MGELRDDLVIASQTRAREPELPAVTVEEVLASPIPAERARYDVVWLDAGSVEAAGAEHALAAQFRQRGHRVFPLSSGVHGGDSVQLLGQLTTLRDDHSIETAVVWIGDPAWVSAALQARERWGWRLLYDGSEANGDEASERLRREADVLLAKPDPGRGTSGLRGCQVDLAAHESWSARWEAVDAAARATFPLASVLVVTTNLLACLRLCVASILANTDYPNYELIVVDNASADGTPEYLDALARQHPHVRTLRNEQRRSFAENNNQALAAANGELLVLLNDDTMVPHGWLTRFARYLEDPRLGLVGPATNRTCNEAQIDVAYQTYGEFARVAR